MDIRRRTEAITGFTFGGASTDALTTDQLNQFILDAFPDIINKILLLAPEQAVIFGRTETGKYNPTSVPSGVVLEVLRENGTATELNNATEIPKALATRSQDINSIHYAGKSHPVWYWDEASNDNKKATVLPTTSDTNGERYTIKYVEYTPIDTAGNAVQHDHDIDTTKVAFFPQTLQHLIPLYCAIRALYLYIAEQMYKSSKLFDIDLSDDDGSETAESVLHWLENEDTEMVQTTFSAQGAEGQFLMGYLQKLATLKSQYDEQFGMLAKSQEPMQQQQQQARG